MMYRTSDHPGACELGPEGSIARIAWAVHDSDDHITDVKVTVCSPGVIALCVTAADDADPLAVSINLRTHSARWLPLTVAWDSLTVRVGGLRSTVLEWDAA